MTFIEGSIAGRDILMEPFPGADGIQAAIPSVPRSVKDPLASNEANVTGTVSVLGAAAHNIAQITVAAGVIGSAALWRGYLPLLLLLAVPTGFFTGLAAFYLEGVTRRVLRQAGGAGAV